MHPYKNGGFIVYIINSNGIRTRFNPNNITLETDFFTMSEPKLVLVNVNFFEVAETMISSLILTISVI